MKLILGFVVITFLNFSAVFNARSPQSQSSTAAVTRSPEVNRDEGSVNQTRALNVDASQVIKRVARRYTKIKSYRSNGVSKHTSAFDGTEKVQTDVPFEIEYLRGKSGFIKWKQNGRANELRIEGKRSWRETDGKVEEEYKSPRDGLFVATLADGGWSLFLIDVFVFRDELLMGDKFFAGLVHPKVINERDLDGRTCYLLSGTYANVEASQTFWIDKEDSLIRRIEKVIIVRNTYAGKEYVNTARTTETHSNIQIQ